MSSGKNYRSVSEIKALLTLNPLKGPDILTFAKPDNEEP
jgi:hypothetical protein